MRYSPWGHKESDTTERLSTHTHTDSTPLHQGYDNASFIRSQLLNLEHKNQIVLSAWAKATKIGNQITLGLLGKKKL